MITLYTGTPGSYKSYHSVKEIIFRLKKGYHVIANFPVDYQRVIKKPLKGSFTFVPTPDLNIDYLLQFAVDHHKPGRRAQTLVVIDEASIKFNAREFNRHDRLDWINFFANHRHFNYDFILVAQSDIMIDKQIRQLIETEYKYRSIAHYKWLGRFLAIVFHGLHIYSDFWYPMQLKNSTHWCFFSKRIADCYDTMGLFIGSKAMDQLQKRQSSLSVKKGSETIVNVKSFKKKRQVNSDLSKFVSVLSAFVQASSSSYNC